MLTACHVFLFVTALQAFSICSKLCSCSRWRGVQMGKVTVNRPSATRNCSCDSQSPSSCLRGRSLHHCAFDCGCGNGARRTLAWFPALQACWSLLRLHFNPLVLMGKPLWVIWSIYHIYDVHTRSLGSSGSRLANRCQDWFCLDSFGHARWNLKIIKVQNITDGISTQ